MQKSLVLIAMLSALIALQTSAQIIGSFSGGDPLSVGPGTAGFEFTVGAQSLTIQTVAVFDEFNDGVLNSSHEVGIWTSADQTLVASADVTPQTATLVNGFFYVNLASPVTLQSGTTYRIGAQYSDVDLDLARGNVPTANLAVNGITLGDAYLSTGTGFTFPDLNVSGADSGFFGPNAGFSAVPEPASTAIVTAAALAALAAIRRWKARQSASAAAAA